MLQCLYLLCVWQFVVEGEEVTALCVDLGVQFG